MQLLRRGVHHWCRVGDGSCMGEGVENVRGTLIRRTENEADKLQEMCTCVLIKDSLIEVRV